MWDGPQTVNWQQAGVSGAPGTPASPTGSAMGDVILVLGVIGALAVCVLLVHAMNRALD
ncbi:MAG: hypothetical protein M0027_18665 [Candidatus Dormibacteraeota bacterium]|jgi:hypothetical protein|nr:hypothetical protein [Candidatus Dormibacteraeota bacterium]